MSIWSTGTTALGMGMSLLNIVKMTNPSIPDAPTTCGALGSANPDIPKLNAVGNIISSVAGVGPGNGGKKGGVCAKDGFLQKLGGTIICLIPNIINAAKDKKAADKAAKEQAATGLPAPKACDNSVVRVAEALLSGHLDIPAAQQPTAPAIVAFNELGECIGVANAEWDDSPIIAAGGYMDFTVLQKGGPGQQATTIQLYGTRGPICIPYIVVRWSDGQIRPVLIGDFARECGADWYYSNIVFSGGVDDHQPSCLWLDNSDSDRKSAAKAVQIHLNEFITENPDVSTTTDPVSFCFREKLIFKHHLDYDIKHSKKEKHTEGHIGLDSTLFGGSSDLAKRNNGRRSFVNRRSTQQRFDHMVTSPHQEHSAVDLCNSPNSRGPDFYSDFEKMFCDMDGGKILYPLCTGQEMAGQACYNLDTQSIITAGAGRVRKQYTHILGWQANGTAAVISLLTASMGNATFANATIGR